MKAVKIGIISLFIFAGSSVSYALIDYAHSNVSDKGVETKSTVFIDGSISDCIMNSPSSDILTRAEIPLVEYNNSKAGSIYYDNFLFDEKTGIPEPAMLLLLGSALLIIAGLRWKNK